jgi:hypothetical protein
MSTSSSLFNPGIGLWRKTMAEAYEEASSRTGAFNGWE